MYWIVEKRVFAIEGLERVIDAETKEGIAICQEKDTASLIAAAPDLLQALEKVLSEVTAANRIEAKAAIAKARGTQ